MKTEIGNPEGVFRNKILATVAYTARVVALTCVSGPLMQTFLSSLGFDSHRIYVHSSILQAVNVLTILIFSGWVSNKNPIKRSAFAILPTALLFLTYLPIAIRQSASFSSYIILCAIGAFQQISIGLFTVCEYKVPYYIYRKSEYGMMLSICGIISSLLSLGVGAVISYFTARVPFTKVMAIAFCFSSLLIVIAFLSILFEKSLISNSEEETGDEEAKKVSIIALLRLPIFSGLIAANVMRGFSAGVIGVLATVALDLGHSESLTAAMVSAQSFASLSACGIFAACSKKLSPIVFLLAGGAFILTLPLLKISGSTGYLLIYTAVILGKTLIDYSVPTLLIRSVSANFAGSYHAWRMVLQNVGTLLATLLASRISHMPLLLIGAAFQLISCISFYICTKNSTKKEQLLDSKSDSLNLESEVTQ